MTIKFTQIAAWSEWVYALDTYGRVWRRHHLGEWKLIENPKDEPYSERESNP